jgi:hypothetical protein
MVRFAIENKHAISISGCLSLLFRVTGPVSKNFVSCCTVLILIFFCSKFSCQLESEADSFDGIDAEELKFCILSICVNNCIDITSFSVHTVC